MKLLGPEELQGMSTLELKHYYEAINENSRVAWHMLRVKEAIDDARN